MLGAEADPQPYRLLYFCRGNHNRRERNQPSDSCYHPGNGGVVKNEPQGDPPRDCRSCRNPGKTQAITRGIERKAEATVVAHRVEARMLRQRLLAQERPPQYRALLDEAVLHRQVGGPMVMNEQLGKILAAVADERAVVQVIPFSVGAHASTDSQFDLLDFPAGSSQRPVVFIEGLFTNRYLERPAEIERYRLAIEFLRDAALSPRDSQSLIRQIRTTYSISPPQANESP